MENKQVFLKIKKRDRSRNFFRSWEFKKVRVEVLGRRGVVGLKFALIQQRYKVTIPERNFGRRSQRVRFPPARGVGAWRRNRIWTCTTCISISQQRNLKITCKRAPVQPENNLQSQSQTTISSDNFKWQFQVQWNLKITCKFAHRTIWI